MLNKRNIISSLKQPKILSENTINMYLSKAAKDGHIQRVRRGVYITPDKQDRMVIACESVPDGYIAYHTALEFHGLCTEEFSCTQIASKKRFRSFEFNFNTYERVAGKYHDGIQTYEQPEGPVRCTTITRTILDCIERPDLCRGHESIWNAILLLQENDIDFQEMATLLDARKNKSLYQRVGYYANAFPHKIKVPEWFNIKCKEASANTVSSTGFNGDTVFDTHWKLRVPREIAEDRNSNIVQYMTREQRKCVQFMSAIIELYKKKHNLSAFQTLELFKSQDIMSWIEENWEILHTTNLDYTISEIDEILRAY